MIFMCPNRVFRQGFSTPLKPRGKFLAALATWESDESDKSNKMEAHSQFMWHLVYSNEYSSADMGWGGVIQIYQYFTGTIYLKFCKSFPLLLLYRFPAINHSLLYSHPKQK